MYGKRIKQINNLTITVKNNIYAVWSPYNVLLCETVDIREAVAYCENVKNFVKQKVTISQVSDSNMFYRKSGNIQLCHGSSNVIQEPYYGGGEVTNDYGSGFYTVSMKNKELAKEWACSTYGDRTHAYVNNYAFNTTDLKILNLDKLDIIYWVTLTATYRGVTVNAQLLQQLQSKYLIDLTEYDCIYGWRCDDTYSKIIRNFMAENLSAEAVKEAVHLGYLQEQFVLKSKRSFERIKFIGAESVKNTNVYAQRFNSRKADADAKVDELKRKHRNGKYLGDYV